MALNIFRRESKSYQTWTNKFNAAWLDCFAETLMPVRLKDPNKGLFALISAPFRKDIMRSLNIRDSFQLLFLVFFCIFWFLCIWAGYRLFNTVGVDLKGMMRAV
jgi:hypothetical protein